MPPTHSADPPSCAKRCGAVRHPLQCAPVRPHLWRGHSRDQRPSASCDRVNRSPCCQSGTPLEQSPQRQHGQSRWNRELGTQLPSVTSKRAISERNQSQYCSWSRGNEYYPGTRNARTWSGDKRSRSESKPSANLASGMPPEAAPTWQASRNLLNLPCMHASGHAKPSTKDLLCTNSLVISHHMTSSVVARRNHAPTTPVSYTHLTLPTIYSV